MLDPVLLEVRQQIETQGLTPSEAAKEIGVGVPSLQKHLEGGYVRSDSLAKYRRWLAGDGSSRTASLRSTGASKVAEIEHVASALDAVTVGPELRQRGRLNVVDLFCGCGGMSLGFERFREGEVFRTALALDIEAPMVRVFNDNHHSSSAEIGIGRQVDITDFSNEAEVQAFYLEHLARTTGDNRLGQHLDQLGEPNFSAFRSAIAEVDAKFLASLHSSRRQDDYLAAVRALGASSLGQTSVIGFHSALKLPTTGTQQPRFGPLLWSGDGYQALPSAEQDFPVSDESLGLTRQRAQKQWDAEVLRLKERAKGSGRGQLASAAARIERFIKFLASPPAQRVRSCWVDWKSQRDALRATYFEDAAVASGLQTMYESGCQVAVLLGGPPCQGFSRIGRGKIRSLREQSVHVHQDDDSVDSRNLLMHQYVLFVAALAPDVFLFENVRHFQAVVRSHGAVFDATDVLAEAICNVSSRGVSYDVARRIVVASQHAVPQNRERFVMAGVRKDVGSRSGLPDAPTLCLSLRRRPAVELRVALDGLASPDYTNEAGENAGLARVTQAAKDAASDSAEQVYICWTRTSSETDAHLARPPRRDDAELFSLMGPGTRWMDYRCDGAPTLSKLADVLGRLHAAISSDPKLAKQLGIPTDEVTSLVASTDGSLTLRLLLECIPPLPGEVSHHLLTPTYLAKRDGAHGDWLSRMDANQPSKTIVSHMAKDTYAFVHPFEPRTLSVREAARIQAFPDDYKFGSVGLVDGFRMVGNAVPPLLSLQFAEKVAKILTLSERRAPVGSEGLVAVA